MFGKILKNSLEFELIKAFLNENPDKLEAYLLHATNVCGEGSFAILFGVIYELNTTITIKLCGSKSSNLSRDNYEIQAYCHIGPYATRSLQESLQTNISILRNPLRLHTDDGSYNATSIMFEYQDNAKNWLTSLLNGEKVEIPYNCVKSILDLKWYGARKSAEEKLLRSIKDYKATICYNPKNNETPINYSHYRLVWDPRKTYSKYGMITEQELYDKINSIPGKDKREKLNYLNEQTRKEYKNWLIRTEHAKKTAIGQYEQIKLEIECNRIKNSEQESYNKNEDRIFYLYRLLEDLRTENGEHDNFTNKCVQEINNAKQNLYKVINEQKVVPQFITISI